MTEWSGPREKADKESEAITQLTEVMETLAVGYLWKQTSPQQKERMDHAIAKLLELSASDSELRAIIKGLAKADLPPKSREKLKALE